MRPNHLRDAFARGETVIGAWVSNESCYIAEVLSHAGFDTVTVDLQHGMFGTGTAVQLLQAVSAGPAVPMARCPALDPAVIGKLLDAGAYGIICPSIDTAEECETFVRACRYPPRGTRSFGPARGLLYGGADYVAHADDTVTAWAMIESASALDEIEQILSAKGLDGVYLGPNDLALALGEACGGFPTESVRAVMLEMVEKARAAGRLVGASAPDLETARWMVDTGFDFVTPGNDVQLLKEAARLRIDSLRSSRTGS